MIAHEIGILSTLSTQIMSGSSKLPWRDQWFPAPASAVARALRSGRRLEKSAVARLSAAISWSVAGPDHSQVAHRPDLRAPTCCAKLVADAILEIHGLRVRPFQGAMGRLSPGRSAITRTLGLWPLLRKLLSRLAFELRARV